MLIYLCFSPRTFSSCSCHNDLCHLSAFDAPHEFRKLCSASRASQNPVYPILFSSTSLSSSKKSQSLFKRWGFYWAFSYLNWEKPIIFRVFFTRLNRKMTFFYFEFRAWVTLSGELKSTVITFRRNRKLVDGEEADMRIARKQAKTGPLNGWKGLREARGPRWCWKWVCGVGIVRTSYPPPSFQKDSAEPLLSELRFGGGLKRDWVCSFHQIVPNFLVG